ncbi:MAG: hypothetical protein Q9227_009421 [Pyrenula ochraceoflavens]
MATSLSLMSASVSFLDSRLSIIHIPIELYAFFSHPILRVLFGDSQAAGSEHGSDYFSGETRTWMNRHTFLNISVTPVECSVICSRGLAEEVFRPLVEKFYCLNQDQIAYHKQDDTNLEGPIANVGSSNARANKNRVEISDDDYVVIEVDGQGLDAGQRVLELTSPLAMASIPIFFMTTYFSDYILVPSKFIDKVKLVLEQRGFTFSPDTESFISPGLQSPSLSHRPHSASSPTDQNSCPAPASTPPSTPPAASVDELQARTFARLKSRQIVPFTDRSIRLVSCAGKRDASGSDLTNLESSLVKILLDVAASSSSSTRYNKPNTNPTNPEGNSSGTSGGKGTRFLSLTLTDAQPLSLFIELSLLHPAHSPSTPTPLSSQLLGSSSPRDSDAILVPIMLDLRDLPLEATGIVCGVAGSLSKNVAGSVEEKEGEGAEGGLRGEALEISFLSTARAGTVLVKERDIERAMGALRKVAGDGEGAEGGNDKSGGGEEVV